MNNDVCVFCGRPITTNPAADTHVYCVQAPPTEYVLFLVRPEPTSNQNPRPNQ